MVCTGFFVEFARGNGTFLCTSGWDVCINQQDHGKEIFNRGGSFFATGRLG